MLSEYKKVNSGVNLSSAVETIYPKVAEQYLTKNIINRPVNNSHVKRLSEAMERDEWVLNGEPIIFDRHGNLKDGQHRLHAIIKFNKPVNLLVVRGVDEGAFDTIDIGIKRAFSDVLSIKGEASTTWLASAVKWLFQLQTGGFATKTSPSHKQLEEVLEQNPKLRDSLAFIKLTDAKKFINPSILVTMHYLMSLESKMQADFFFERLGDGCDLAKNSPIYALREKHVRLVGQDSRKRPNHIVKDIIVAWNAYRENRKLKIIKTPDYMPVII